MKTSRYLKVIQAIHAFLQARDRGNWILGDAPELQAAGPMALREYALSRSDLVESGTFDADSGRLLPMVFDIIADTYDVRAARAAYLFDDVALFLVCIEDADYCRYDHVLVACPDSARLPQAVRDIAEFAIASARRSDWAHGIGGGAFPVDRKASWDDVVLPQDLERDIRSNVESFLTSRALYEKLGLAYKRGFMFLGGPGNGKSTLCRVIVSQSRLPCVVYFGSNNRGLDEAFQKASRLAPCVLVLEDIDRVFSDVEEVSLLLNLMDGLRSREGILTLGTANFADRIDPAILNRPSRFDRVWKIGNPDVACRVRYLARLFEGHLKEADLEDAAEQTEGLSCAYLKELFISSAYLAAQRGSDRIDTEVVQEVVDLLRKQHRAGEAGYDVETIGFNPNDDES